LREEESGIRQACVKKKHAKRDCERGIRHQTSVCKEEACKEGL
jgi:hypothetical protein